jgi:hypothetical protein
LTASRITSGPIPSPASAAILKTVELIMCPPD